MGNGEREDENRRLAEWVGWHYFHNHWHSLACPRNAYGVRCICAADIPDFRTDEAANALLLEKMPAPELTRLLKHWHCRADINVSTGYVGFEAIRDPDRKTAIALAALALLNERGSGGERDREG